MKNCLHLFRLILLAQFFTTSFAHGKTAYEKASRAIGSIFDTLTQLNEPLVQKFFESTPNAATAPAPFYQPISGAPIGYHFIAAYVNPQKTGRYWVYKHETDIVDFYDEPLRRIPGIILSTQQLKNDRYLGHYNKYGATFYMYHRGQP
jgi:hypothetical protein